MSRSRALWIAVYTAALTSAATLLSCFLCDDEETLIRACDRITATVNDVELSCGLATSAALVVCGSVCTDYGRCPEDSEVDACAEAIAGLGCDAIASRASYAGLDACADIFADMAESCSSSGDFDDDD